MIIDRNIKANYTIRIIEKKSGKSVIVSIYTEEDNLKSLKNKIKEALK